ncbi:MAG: hypothetical protein ACYYKD_04460 [Rhodospirillales bacterium]
MRKPRKFDPTWPPQDANWARTPKGRFHNLNTFDPVKIGLGGISGVYVIWHSGIKPKWVYVDRDDDLAGAMAQALDNKFILQYHPNGGLFVSWSMIAKPYQDGVVRYLHTVLAPAVKNPAAEKQVQPIAVNAPGVRTIDMTDPRKPPART